MNYIKIILIAVGVVLATMVAFSLLGIISTALWYLFLLGIVAIGGAVGYKFLTRGKEQPKLAEKTPVTIADFQDTDRALEEYKRKYLTK